MLTVIGGSCQKYNFCCNKSFVATNMCLSWQNTHLSQQNMSSVMTKVCLPAVTKLLSQQNDVCHEKYFCHNMCLSWQKFYHGKHTFVATKDVFCCDKRMFVTTKISLLQQNFCCDKNMFVVTNVLLWQAYFCHDKRCVCHDKTFVWTHSKHHFPAPSSKLCQNWLCHQKGMLYLCAPVYWCC